jgi:hypothetical protein
VAQRIGRGGLPVGEWRLGDRRRQLRVTRRDLEDVTAGQREAPDRDPGWGHSRQGSGEADRGLPVVQLFPDADDLARLPAALAEMAVVKGKHAEAGSVESPRE